MKKRLITLLLAAAFSVVLITACADRDQTANNPSEPAKAIFITNSSSNTPHGFSLQEFQRLTGDFNIEMTHIFSNETADELEGIEQAIAGRYDVIFINPVDAEAVVPALTRANEAGIIIGMFSTDLPPAHQHIRHFFCGSNEFEGAMQAGQFISQKFPDGANAVEVGGRAGDDLQIKLHEGFIAGLSYNILMLETQNCPGGWEPREARTIMDDFLSRHGDAIDIVWCHWDDGARAVIEATRAAGRSDIFVIGMGGSSVGYQQVKDGFQALTVGPNFSDMVRQSLQNARTILDGGSVAAINIIPMEMVTIDNVNDLPWPEW